MKKIKIFLTLVKVKEKRASKIAQLITDPQYFGLMNRVKDIIMELNWI